MTGVLQFTAATLVLLTLIMMVRRVLVWSKGRAVGASAFALVRIPKRYFVDVHHKVDRRKGASRMHVLAAGGAVALALLLLFAALSPVLAGGFAWIMRGFAVMTLIGVGLDLARRWPKRRFALSAGAWTRFPIALGLIAGGIGVATFLPVAPLIEIVRAPLGLVAVGSIALGLIGLFLVPAFSGPFKHAFAGVIHLAYHPRSERFEDVPGGKQSALRTIEVDGEVFGTPTFSDMDWTRLLSFDACVECGRCEEACPAFAAGQPLNPKALIQDLARSSAGACSAKGYAGSPHPGRPLSTAELDAHGPIVGGAVAPETLWSCTTCRACVDSCPMFIEHVDTIIDLRRAETLEHGATPEGAERVLRSLRENGAPGIEAPDLRDRWARNAAVPLLSDVGQTDVLLWLGDTIGDERTRATLLGLVTLMQDAGVDFAVLGSEEGDTGDLARRLGDEVTFRRLAQRNIDVLQKYTFKQIVTSDPHVMHCLRNEYPALGASYEVLHHSDFLKRLVDAGQLRLRQDAIGAVTYHDPCYLGRYNMEFDAPRSLLTQIGAELREMDKSKLTARCCGGGGGAPQSDIPGERRIADMRVQDAQETGAQTLVVGCPNCRSMLDGAASDELEVVDLVELLLSAREANDV